GEDGRALAGGEGANLPPRTGFCADAAPPRGACRGPTGLSNRPPRLITAIAWRLAAKPTIRALPDLRAGRHARGTTATSPAGWWSWSRSFGALKASLPGRIDPLEESLRAGSFMQRWLRDRLWPIFSEVRPLRATAGGRPGRASGQTCSPPRAEDPPARSPAVRESGSTRRCWRRCRRS